MGRGFANPPRPPPVGPRPESALVKGPPRLNVSNPGDQWTGQAGVGFIVGNVLAGRHPDAILAFCADDLYNCISIDFDVKAVDDGWIVPDFTTLYLAEQAPAVFSNGTFFPFNIARPFLRQAASQATGANVAIWDRWDWINTKDFTAQPVLIRATPTIGPFLNPISVALPDRQLFNKQGTRLFRFALMAMWMYRRDPTHTSLTFFDNPTFTFRCWYDPARTTLLDIK